MSKLRNALVFGLGYVLGAQAGRARYEELKRRAILVAQHPKTQQLAEQARQKVAARLPSRLGGTPTPTTGTPTPAEVTDQPTAPTAPAAPTAPTAPASAGEPAPAVVDLTATEAALADGTTAAPARPARAAEEAFERQGSRMPGTA